MSAKPLRILCLALLLIMLPAAVLGEGNPDEPVIRSEFTFRPVFLSSGFPDDGALHYSDWETLFNRLSLRGTADSQRPLQPVDSYTRMEAALYVNDRETIPFLYENYGYSRYLTSPAFLGDTIYFNMLNFDLFMLKPYTFLGLPTNLMSLLIYPEQFADLYNRWSTGFSELTQGKTTVSYQELLTFAEYWSDKMANDHYSRYECLCLSLLCQVYGNDQALEDLLSLPGTLEAMDPRHQGMTIRQKNGRTEYILNNQVFMTVADGYFDLSLIGGSSGYSYRGGYERKGDTMTVNFLATCEDEERLGAEMLAQGLFDGENDLDAEGDITVRVWGGAVSESLETDEIALTFRFSKTLSSTLYPREEKLSFCLLHPETGKPCLGFSYEAVSTRLGGEVVINQREKYTAMDLPETFCMNSVALENYKARYVKPIAVSLVPVLMETPSGVLSDLFAFAQESGILAVLGIELY